MKKLMAGVIAVALVVGVTTVILASMASGRSGPRYSEGPGTVPQEIASFAGHYLDGQLCADGTGTLNQVLLEGATTATMLPKLNTGLQRVDLVVKAYPSDAPFYAVLVHGSCASQAEAKDTYTEGYVMFGPSGQVIAFRGWYKDAPADVTNPFGGLLLDNS
jgi:hypothetical protein